MDDQKVEQAEKIFGARFEDNSGSRPEWYLESSQLSLEDQKWIWDNISYNSKAPPKSKRFRVKKKEIPVNRKLKQDKHEVIEELKKCNYLTPRQAIADCLESLLGPSEKPGHWLWVAQRWTARQINWIIADMIKQYRRGTTTIRTTPAHYFTFLIKKRKRRKRD